MKRRPLLRANRIPPTARGIVALRNTLGLSVCDLAKILGVHVATVYRWEDPGSKPSPDALAIEILFYLRTGAAALSAPSRRAWASRLKEAAHETGALGALRAMTSSFPAQAIATIHAGGTPTRQAIRRTILDALEKPFSFACELRADDEEFYGMALERKEAPK